MISAIDLYRQETAAYARRSCRYRKSLTAPEWSEKVRRMDGGKRYRFDFAPYQREMMLAPYDPQVQVTVYMLASRLGKTEVIMNIIGHGTAERPRRILVMYPTISQAEKWSKETYMNELVAPTPSLDRLVGDGSGRRKSGNTILHKMFPGGLMNVFGSNAPGEMRRAKGNLLLADEIDAIVGNESDEGDPLEIFWVRGSEYPDTIKIAASYPSIKGRSRIESLMIQSDFRIWKSHCIHCDTPYQMHRKHLRYDPDKPEKAILECPSCSKAIDDNQRREMTLHRSEWEATREFNGIRGFQGNGMMSPHPKQKGFVSHLHWVAVQELNALNAENVEKATRVIVNTFDGEPYEAPEEEKPDPEGLEQEAYDFLSKDAESRIRVPDNCLVITVGCDVQNDRLEAEYVGFGQNGHEYGLGYHVLSGNPREPEVWSKLEQLITREFLHPSGAVLKPACVCIDSKYLTTNVREFTLPRQPRRVFPVIGSTVLGKPLVSPPRKSGKHKVYELGTHEAKDSIYQRAHLRRDKSSTEFPHGYMHFPTGYGYQSEYFRRLLIEDVELKKASDGDYYRFFSNPDRRRNEPLDVRVYAKAACAILKPAFAKIARKYAQKAKNNQKPEEETLPLPKTDKNFLID